ncbi:MAG: heavy metal-associated domain-containing protein [bacterium]|nr:heavy metal-associated domain-containing protein [bacterium]
MYTTNFKVSGMTCQSCVKLIEKSLEKVNGIQGITVDLAGNGAVTANREVSKDELQTALATLSYKVS